MPRKPASRPAAATPAAPAVLTLTSRNYSAWSLRGWLMTRFAGLEVALDVIPPDDPDTRAELLLMSSTIRVPRLLHEGITVWDTLAIGEYLHEVRPDAGLLPADRAARAHCRAIAGEAHSGFAALRSALPMNLKAHVPRFRVWSKAQADIDHLCAIWRDALARHGGPFLFGERPTLADAMFAPDCTRFFTYDVALDEACRAYCEHLVGIQPMQEWMELARSEPDDIEELDVEF
ncbi:MAG: glutathione S-transferase [Burkholderiales bacterium]|nr:glutathione S-transferase [Burkholderiales bacterium]